MSHRYVPLASLLGGLLFTGCVIYTEPQDGPPPPPPPPPGVAQPAPPAAQPAPPNAPPPEPSGGGVGAINHGNLVSRLKVGEILVMIGGGNCNIGVDGTSKGVSNQLRMKVGEGEHTITCTPEGKGTQTQKANVKHGELVTVTFDLTNPANNTTVSKPVNIAPPVGRPTPGQ